ncbi:pleckstrin homology domain-containing family G member 6 [Anabas testudineus]|uniref:DH domain-containing protein n=1 Tax=Anabas testudineus TaxID=64144 RepID=A0A3Q1JDS3_ANATE|nr:pleckstrin homology domain-containing family G member 6 [Anabas testudineus]
MDPTKPSLSSKAPHVNNDGGNESSVEEGSVLWRDTVDGERLRDMESREPDVDGVTAAAEINHHHRGSADKHKFRTLGYQRRTKQKVVTDFVTVSKGAFAGGKQRAALRQSLFSQGVSDKSSASEERGQLDVLKQALQTFAVPDCLKWRWKEEGQGSTLEKNWTDLVQSHSTMSKIQRHQQEALWEFVHTELTYINKLIIIKDLVLAALVNLHQHGFLLEVTPELLFSNLPSILSAHQLFWQEVIYPMLHEVRRTGKPFDPQRLKAGCLKFHERFLSYKHYCWEEENNLEFTRRQMENNPHFHTYVQWVETHPQCDRMRLGDMQAKPHQRITKYPLLLKAVLRYTQDTHVQHTLRGMISSVIVFLESINDYLRLKDEQLALSISAERVEGYEVEGINEEIDKHVKEICQFDLTCPIRGVGSNVIRKLLLEENLKLRGRKDSKLEVVALLFSDVLLLTKIQKKGERLKVVRPPLTLDRTHCIALKDGCSFVLVEVGELQSAMSVYIISASTPERCATWISNIQQAKETLMIQRESEANRKQQNWKIQQVEIERPVEAEMEDLETEEQHLTQSDEDVFANELEDEFISPHLSNGMVQTTEADEESLEDVGTDNRGSPFGSMPTHNKQESVQKIVESQLTNEQRVSLNHRASNLDNYIPSNAADSLRYKTTGNETFLIGGLPDVDYPTNEDDSLQLSNKPTLSRREPVVQQLPAGRRIVRRRNSDFNPMNQETSRNSSNSDSDDTETYTKSWVLSRNLKSPGIQRKKPVSTLQGPLAQISHHDSKETLVPSNTSSSSNTDSDYNLNTKRNSISSGQSSETHRVLKLGSLKPNQGMFWTLSDRESQDPQTLSESELPDLNKRPKIKSQLSTSIPNISTEGGHESPLPPSSMSTSPQRQNNMNGHSSLLEGLLEKAKVKKGERDGLKRDRDLRRANLSSSDPPPSPSFSTTPSDGDRETESG